VGCLRHGAGYEQSYAASNRCLRFGKQHAEYLRGLVPYNNVAVLASRRSTDFGGAPRAPYSVMQSLLRANIGFDVIADEDLEPGALGRYRVLVLDNARCMVEDAAVAPWSAWGRPEHWTSSAARSPPTDCSPPWG